MSATKDEIARTFSALVTRFGYRRTSVEDVARALHISKKTIYDFFSSKEDLYRYAIELWAKEQRARVESLLTEPTALGRIAQATSIAFADARRGFEANPLGDDTESPEIVAEVNTKVFGPIIRDLIVQGNATGEFAVADPERTAAFGVAIGVEAVRMLREDPSSHAEEAALDAMRRLVAGVVE
jgi:AcrR family transcriptional regulator